MKNKIRVLFVAPGKAPFIEQDLEILSRNFEIRTCYIFERGRNFSNSAKVFYRLIRGLLSSDIAFCWFADIHSLWAVRFCRVLRRKSIIVVGGYETARIPEIEYGLLIDKHNEMMIREIFERADMLLPVSHFVKNEMLQFVRRNNIEVVYNCIDLSKFPPRKDKEDIVLTAGDATAKRYRLKGIDTFARAAEMVPNTRFIVAGDTDKKTLGELEKISRRVEYVGRLSHDKLLDLLSRAKVYCQLSMRESFGMSLLESAASGCRIIATMAGAIPEIIGNKAIYVPYGDHNATANAIRQALSLYKTNETIFDDDFEKFSAREREKALTKIIRSLINNSHKNNKQ